MDFHGMNHPDQSGINSQPLTKIRGFSHGLTHGLTHDSLVICNIAIEAMAHRNS